MELVDGFAAYNRKEVDGFAAYNRKEVDEFYSSLLLTEKQERL